jgi:homopolymeric O-antigen transport system ATP-binding protein
VPVIDAESVSKHFLLRHNASVELKVRALSLLHPSHRQSIEEFWALKNVSLRIDHGEAVGLVGRNGSGKSTLLKLIAAIYRPTSGRILVARSARIASMIELGVGFHPELTGRENVFLNAAIQGLTKPEIERIYADIVEYSGLEHFIDIPIKNYSSGMHMRLGFAISANLDPDILLLDEVFAVGDADFQQRCIATVRRFIDDGKTIIFVSHSPAAVRTMCRRVCVLEQGQLSFDGPVEPGLSFYEALITRRGLGESSHRSNGETLEPAGLTETDLERSPHRIASGGFWQQTGAWQLDFLRSQGLQPQEYVLDVGCGSLAGAVHLAPFLEPGRYWGLERDSAIVQAGLHLELPRAGIPPERVHVLINDAFQLDAIPHCFDFAIASSLFPCLPFNSLAMCIAGVVRKLNRSGKFFATWFENPDAANFDPVIHPGVGTTYSDRVPYHYSFELLAHACAAVGATVERVGGVNHPRGESVLLITRQPARH